MYRNFFFRKSILLRNNVEKYGRNKQASYDSIIQRIRFARWVNNALDRHSEYVILIAFSTQKNGFANAPQYYVYSYIVSFLCFNFIFSAIDKGAGTLLYVRRSK